MLHKVASVLFCVIAAADRGTQLAPSTKPINSSRATDLARLLLLCRPSSAFFCHPAPGLRSAPKYNSILCPSLNLRPGAVDIYSSDQQAILFHCTKNGRGRDKLASVQGFLSRRGGMVMDADKGKDDDSEEEDEDDAEEEEDEEYDEFDEDEADCAGGFRVGQRVKAAQDLEFEDSKDVVLAGTSGTVLGPADTDPDELLNVEFVKHQDGHELNVTKVNATVLPSDLRKGWGMRIFSKGRRTKVAIATLGVLATGLLARRCGCNPRLDLACWLQTSWEVVKILTNKVSPVFVLLAGALNQVWSALQPLNLLRLALERAITFGIPLLIIGMLIAETGEELKYNFRGLGKLFKDERSKKMYQERIAVTSLADDLASYEYTMQRVTGSKKDALDAARRRDFKRRFEDELGTIGDSGLAAISFAESGWKDKVADAAEEAQAARAEMREIAVQLGGNMKPTHRNSTSKGQEESRSKLSKRLKKKVDKLTKSLKKVYKYEASFLREVSEGLGQEHWEARKALSSLAQRPLSWDPLSPVLETAHSGRSNESKLPPRAFVLDFFGDVEASSVATLRREVTAVLGSANATRGDIAVVRLVSGGGSVTAYGLAAAQLLRLKEGGLNLTVCVEQVAASGGYMMACVADKIVASPLAALGSIGVLSEMPNVYERLKKEGVEFSTITAGDYKRTLTPTKKLNQADVRKARQEVGEIFGLFKSFVARHRPQLNIKAVATGEVWFGEDAIQRKLADSIQTYDDVLLQLYRNSYEIYSVKYVGEQQRPQWYDLFDDDRDARHDSFFPQVQTRLDGPYGRSNWLARFLRAALRAIEPTEPHPHQHQIADPRYRLARSWWTRRAGRSKREHPLIL